MAKIQRRLRRAEDSLEQAASAFDQLVDDLETGSASAPAAVRRSLARGKRPLPVASACAAMDPRTMTFAVHGVDFRVDLNGVQMALLALLAIDTKESPDELVAFKSIGSLVHTLHNRGYRATRRSVTVEVSRLRAVLGRTNRELIESRRGAGYRFRLPAAVARSCVREVDP